jgi:hypothetical protein
VEHANAMDEGKVGHSGAATYKYSHKALQVSSSNSAFKRQGSILPFLAHSAGQTRHSAGETRSADSPCVFCIYACNPCEPETTMMGELEHATVLNSVLRFWSLNAATTEPLTLSHQCAELASSLQASSRDTESEDLAPGEASTQSIDAEMVLEHMTRHRCDDEGQLAMLRQTLFTACASERVLTRTMFVCGKGGKLQLDAATAQQHRVVTGTTRWPGRGTRPCAQPAALARAAACSWLRLLASAAAGTPFANP